MTLRAGAIRFNTDSSQMEIWDGNQWTGILSTSPELETGGTRGLVFGGGTPSPFKQIDFYNINSTGDATDFGDMLENTYSSAGTASRVRGISFGGGNDPYNTIEFVTIASTGDSQDFGDMVEHRRNAGAGSNGVRGVVIGGWTAPQTSPGYHNRIDHITIATTGNAVDFGDMVTPGESGMPVVNSPTRIVYGQMGTPSGYTNQIEFITTSTTGNAADFGDVTGDTRGSGAGGSNAVRGIFAGGQAPNQPAYTPQDEIHYLTMATLGNTTDFGDLTAGRGGVSACASPTRVVFNGGGTPTVVNTLDYIQIMTTGNAIDFGDLNNVSTRNSGCSNGHGGL